MKVSVKNFKGKVNTLDLPITQEQIDTWKNGELIQKAMPNLSPEHREFLMTGMMPGEWEEMFSKENM